jgi:hypothetical protein
LHKLVKKTEGILGVNAWDKISTVFILCFGSTGTQTIHYFKLI